jgi:hypothetical protein
LTEAVSTKISPSTAQRKYFLMVSIEFKRSTDDYLALQRLYRDGKELTLLKINIKKS